ncbi:MAG: tRNA threonylcarbamoyladenosine biosynthesis protein TsaE [Sulfitobacter sp.]|jgi:tRNA threonylcarbamoyladenosine biosynthesis protein TsaE
MLRHAKSDPSPLITVEGSLPSTEATKRLAAQIGSVLQPGDTLLLTGQLGTGKTFFARSLIQSRLAALGLWEDVPSPSFTLVQTYELGPDTLWHVDLYRLSGPGDAVELGLDDAVDTAICLIEWPDRLGDLRPASAIDLTLTDAGDDRRTVSLSGPDTPQTRRILDIVRATLELEHG